MEITVKGTPEEIAALVVELQKRQGVVSSAEEIIAGITNGVIQSNEATNDTGAD